MCGAALEAETITAFGEAFLAHCHANHADLPYPDDAKRVVGESVARMTGSAERLDAIGAVAVHPVTEDRIDDWLDLFDQRVHVTAPHNGLCYCLEPHEVGSPVEEHVPWDWEARRAAMAARLRSGTTYGYLAYVDGVAAGWVNASARGDYSMFRRGDEDDACTIGIACFAIAPPYRGHNLAKALLDAVIADAGERGAAAIEAYPFNEKHDLPNFRGDRKMFDARGFAEVKVRQRDTVVRRPVG